MTNLCRICPIFSYSLTIQYRKLLAMHRCTFVLFEVRSRNFSVSVWSTEEWGNNSVQLPEVLLMVDIWRPIALRIPFNLCCVALSLSLSLSLWLFPSLVPSQCQWPHAVREPRVDFYLTGSFLYSPTSLLYLRNVLLLFALWMILPMRWMHMRYGGCGWPNHWSD